MGEFRFDQLIPKAFRSSKKFKKIIKFKNPNKKIICFGSTGPNEDLLLIKVIKILFFIKKIIILLSLFCMRSKT